jgi:hypothetical protein
MFDNLAEKDDGQQARFLAFQKSADPSLIERLLQEYQGKFLVAPEEREVYFIQGPGKVFYDEGLFRIPRDDSLSLSRKNVQQHDGVTAISWSLIGPSNGHPEDERIIQQGGKPDSYLAGYFYFRLQDGRFEPIELPQNFQIIVDNFKSQQSGDQCELPLELLPALYVPIRRLIDKFHDDFWKDKLIAYQESLLLPRGAVLANVRRKWYLTPPTGASETIDGTLYFVTIEYPEINGQLQIIQAVEKDIRVLDPKYRDEHGLALNKPSDMVKKHRYMQENGIPTYDWVFTNSTDTKLFVPDLTEDGSEVLDVRIYNSHFHPEDDINREFKNIKLPDWAIQSKIKIDEQIRIIIRQVELAGMEMARDCLYIVHRGTARVMVGDLGQGLFNPDDPNKGKTKLRVKLF